jgi:hypothetical protein
MQNRAQQAMKLPVPLLSGKSSTPSSTTKYPAQINVSTRNRWQVSPRSSGPTSSSMRILDFARRRTSEGPALESGPRRADVEQQTGRTHRNGGPNDRSGAVADRAPGAEPQQTRVTGVSRPAVQGSANSATARITNISRRAALYIHSARARNCCTHPGRTFSAAAKTHYCPYTSPGKAITLISASPRSRGNAKAWRAPRPPPTLRG